MKIALLIDAENVSARHFPAIMAHVRRLGDATIRQLFGDFTGNARADWTTRARGDGLETICQLAGGKGKNSTDIAMTVGAMDILHDGLVDAFCIVSSDRDFLPLVLRLKRAGMQVFGVGNAGADEALRNACHDFHPLEDSAASAARKASTIVDATAAAVPPTLAAVGEPHVDPQIAALICNILADKVAGGQMHLSRLAAAMRDHEPSLVKDFCRKGKFRKNLGDTGAVIAVGDGNWVRLRDQRQSA